VKTILYGGFHQKSVYELATANIIVYIPASSIPYNFMYLGHNRASLENKHIFKL